MKRTRRAARRAGARRAPPARLHLRPEGRASQHYQVPRRVHGRAHRTRLVPRLPPTEVRAGRWLQGLHRVGVRVGGAPVTLALRARPLAALQPVTLRLYK
ncbi:jg1414 [Pararge aegeria aegeria]|uniref:Jg1414 protein n=1 Tax=Pararge aegeria aegeria TaxID=348720 RepID=A0A8S4RNE8_9NEOP|nr:jg1414 [Pararge aegeria aegeria]